MNKEQTPKQELIERIDGLLMPFKLYTDPTNSLKPIDPEKAYTNLRDAIAQAWLEDREKEAAKLKADLARAMGHMESCGHPDKYLLDRHPEFAPTNKSKEVI